MSERRRICFVIPTLEPGGTERQLLYLLEGLAEYAELTVVCTRRAGEWGERARQWAALHELGCAGGWDPRLAIFAARGFRAVRPHVMHSFLFGFDFAFNAAARKAGVPIIVSSRRELAEWKSPRHIRLQQRANRLADAIVANSHAAADFAIAQENADPALFRVIPNAIVPQRFQHTAGRAEYKMRLGIPAAAAIVGMVANFSPVKDHALFLAVAAELRHEIRGVHFLLVGTGPLLERFRRDASALGLSEALTIVSNAREMAPIYGAMDGFVLTSRVEGSPNVLLEAMAAGVPVVAAAVGGIPEIVQHGVTGILIPSRDPRVFASAIAGLLRDPASSGSMADRAACEIRRNHSVEALVTRHRDLYDELAARQISDAEAG